MHKFSALSIQGKKGPRRTQLTQIEGTLPTVFAQIEARASIYLESRLDQAYIRDRLLFETGLYCFKEWLIKESLREATHQSTI